jgi:hypothetical protein
VNQDVVILGVDAHLDVHVGAVTGSTGRLLETQARRNDRCRLSEAAGYLKLQAI